MRNQSLTAVVTARFISLIGTNMTVVALPWFVLSTTGSTTKMGLVLACQTLPTVVLGVPGGAAVAALGSRRALVLGDAVRAPLLTAVPLLALFGLLSFPALLALVSLVGVFTVPYTAAASALLPDLVGDDEREVARAQGALQVAVQLTGIVGPAVAGILIPFIGVSKVLYLDAASYALSASILFAFVRRPTSASISTDRTSMFVGIRFMFSDALLRSILTGAFMAHIAFAALMASLPVLAFREFHDARVGGFLFATIAAGSVFGGILAMRLARQVRPLTLACSGFAVMAAPIWVLVAGRPLILVTVVVGAFGVGSQLGVSPITAVLTTRAPAKIRSQTVSAFLAISNAGVPLGSAITGTLIVGAGFGVTYAIVAASMTAATLLLILNVRRLHV
jgi:MFS family permease